MRRQILSGFSSQVLTGLLGLIFISVFSSKFGEQNYARLSILLTLCVAILNLDGLQKPLVQLISLQKTKNQHIELLEHAGKFSTYIGIALAITSMAILVFFFKQLLSELGNAFFPVISVAIFVFLYFSRTPYMACFIADNKAQLVFHTKAVTFFVLFSSALVLMSISGSVAVTSISLILGGAAGWLFVGLFSPSIPTTKEKAHNRRHKNNYLLKEYLSGVLFNFAVFSFLLIDKYFIIQLNSPSLSNYMIPHDIFLRLSVIYGVIGTVMLGRAVNYYFKSDLYSKERRNEFCKHTIESIVLFFFRFHESVFISGGDIVCLSPECSKPRNA